MIELNQDNLNEIIKSSEKVVVQFGASWCGNCRLIKPKFKKLASEHSDITFIYADAEQFPGSRALADVSALPTFAVYQNGNLVKQAQGNKIEIVQELLNEITNH